MYVCRMGDETADHVYNMLMKNFERVYSGEEDDFGDFQPSNRPPWGLYMHAAWFFGDYSWHFEGYRMFLEVKFFYLMDYISFFCLA